MGAVAVKIGVFVFGAFLIFIAGFFGYKSIRSIIFDIKEMRVKKKEKAENQVVLDKDESEEKSKKE